MATWTNRDVRVTQDAEYIHLRVGPEGHSVPRERVAEILSGDSPDPLLLLTSMLVAARLAGVNVSNAPAVKQFIESRQWPWVSH